MFNKIIDQELETELAFALGHVNKMLEKYPDGKLSGPERVLDDNLCSQDPLYTFLWFMIYLSGYSWGAHPNETPSSLVDRYIEICQKRYDHSPKQVSQGTKLIHDLQLIEVQDRTFKLFSRRLQLELPVAQENPRITRFRR